MGGIWRRRCCWQPGEIKYDFIAGGYSWRFRAQISQRINRTRVRLQMRRNPRPAPRQMPRNTSAHPPWEHRKRQPQLEFLTPALRTQILTGGAGGWFGLEL